MLASVLLLAACVPTTLARFVDSPAVTGNAFQARQSFGGVHLATGSHVGNAMDNRAITGLGFTPDYVLIKATSNRPAVSRSSSMAGDVSKAINGASALQANRIQSLDVDGFTLGTHATVNANGAVYSWVAFRAAPGVLSVSSYVGNGALTHPIAGLGFSPDYVVVLGAGASAPVQRSTPMSVTYRFDQTAAAASGILSLDVDGFTVGNSAQVNQNGTVYHYLSWNATPGSVAVGSYAGNGTDDRSITNPGLPDYVVVRRSTTGNACDRTVQRTADLSGDQTLYFANVAAFANGIQALQASGFQVGTDCRVNTNGSTYYYVAFKDF